MPRRTESSDVGPNVYLKRAYEPAARGDGFRLLVDRLWPRGVSKEALQLDMWAKEIAPSTELRKWFGHDPKRWTEFRRRYESELTDPAIRTRIREIVTASKDASAITLVYGARDTVHNEAAVLGARFKRLIRARAVREARG